MEVRGPAIRYMEEVLQNAARIQEDLANAVEQRLTPHLGRKQAGVQIVASLSPDMLNAHNELRLPIIVQGAE